MTAYYNENDPNAAAWLRELIREGHIAPGDVDERSILDVKPDDLRAYTQCHFFAGVGVWSHALRRAGWPDGRPVWTGSCPCQPFSAAGKRSGIADERHLWPAWQWLVGQCRPDVVFGEQVASKDGLAWLDLVRTDMEGTDYAVGFFDLCAAGFGAPHIRQRLYFSARSMAEPAGERWERRRSGETRAEPGTVERPERLCASGRMADAELGGRKSRGIASPSPQAGVVAAHDALGGHAGAKRQQRSGQHGQQQEDGRYADGLDDAAGTRHIAERPGAEGETRDEAWLCGPKRGRGAGGLELSGGERRERRETPAPRNIDDRQASVRTQSEHGFSEPGAHRLSNWDATGPVNGFWRDADWLACRDERWRPVEPGTFPLAHGVAHRVVKLRGCGNAIVAPQAAAFVEAYLAAERDGFARLGEDIFG